MIEARNRSPEEWEREIEQTRADIDRTLTALRLSLSWGAIMDRLIRSARDGDGAFAACVGRTIRDNPVPTVVLSAGLGWLLMASRERNGGPRVVEAGAVATAATPAPAPASPMSKVPDPYTLTETMQDIRGAHPLGTP